jgi:hypothetical protein
MSLPTAIAVLPNRGMIKPQSGESFYGKASAGKLNVLALTLHTSVLESTFNELWVAALNARAECKPRYFAMLHDDVCPEHFWLDKLVEELEKHDADIVSAVMPIRDLHGMTTTGATDPDDIWSTQLRRLSVKEALKLPKTFGIEDLHDGVFSECSGRNQCLLVGTGCWVCRFDSPWVDDIVWRLESQNVLVDGTWSHRRQSEDWLFSIDAHKLGLKALATTAVKMYHGDTWFNNHSPWGEWSEDNVWRNHETERKALTDSGFVGGYPADVAGWLSPTEGLALSELARDKDVLEIGSYCGKSTICLAQHAKSVTAVDPFDGRGTPSERNTYDEFSANLEKYRVADKVSAIRGTIGEVAHQLGEFDLVFIDGAHDYQGVKDDIADALSVLRADGVLAFHDYGSNHPGVVSAVEELIADGGEAMSQHGTIVVVRPKTLAIVRQEFNAPVEV